MSKTSVLPLSCTGCRGSGSLETPLPWHMAIQKGKFALFRLVLPLQKLIITPSVTQLVSFCQMSSTAISQSWSGDQQLAFDISHLSNFDQEQLLTNGDQLWPLIWPSMTKIFFRVFYMISSGTKILTLFIDIWQWSTWITYFYRAQKSYLEPK